MEVAHKRIQQKRIGGDRRLIEHVGLKGKKRRQRKVLKLKEQ